MYFGVVPLRIEFEDWDGGVPCRDCLRAGLFVGETL